MAEPIVHVLILHVRVFCQATASRQSQAGNSCNIGSTFCTSPVYACTDDIGYLVSKGTGHFLVAYQIYQYKGRFFSIVLTVHPGRNKTSVFIEGFKSGTF